jgi:lysosomal Pro-X carboxypeptidase
MALSCVSGHKIETASNIVYSNGDLDPWSGTGVLQDLSDRWVALTSHEVFPTWGPLST